MNPTASHACYSAAYVALFTGQYDDTLRHLWVDEGYSEWRIARHLGTRRDLVQRRLGQIGLWNPVGSRVSDKERRQQLPVSAQLDSLEVNRYCEARFTRPSASGHRDDDPASDRR